MATIKAEYYDFNGASWDLVYFKTSADLIVETASYKVMTAGERALIENYLAGFNGADELALIGSDGKLPSSIIPALAYLSLAGGTLTGQVNGTKIALSGDMVVGGKTYINGGIGSDNAIINFTGLDLVNFGQAILEAVGDPIDGTDAANKQYVDAKVAAGMRPIAAVKAATTANITTSGLVTIDGYTLQVGDRVLVWKQTVATDNGIYVAGTGLWSKQVNDSKQGAFVFVENGNTQHDWFFHATSDTTWIDHSRIDTILHGAGLSKSGNTLLISAGGVTNAMLAGSIATSKIASFGAAEQDGWVDLEAANATKTLDGHFHDLYSIIRLLRGTANYNTQNTETISGAYARANSKAAVERGSTVPISTLGKNAGDIYLRVLA